MRKAIFDRKQKAVTKMGDYFQIAVNEVEQTVTDESGERIEWEYDFNEFRDSTLDLAKVKADPNKYLDYVPKEPIEPGTPEKKIAERVVELQEALTAQIEINELQDETIIEIFEMMEG